MRLAPTSATEAVIDALAVHRLTKLAQDDEVWPVLELREAFQQRAGNTRWADLADCPWCLSMWIGVGVTAARAAFPRAWPLAARVLAGSAVAGHLAGLE